MVHNFFNLFFKFIHLETETMLQKNTKKREKRNGSEGKNRAENCH